MTRRNWKRVFPTSLRDALRLCKDYAQERKNYSVERIADLMDVSPDVLYKWLSTGKMPASTVPLYEHICGINFATRWLATSFGGCLVIPMPTGRDASASDMQVLQEHLNTAVGSLIRFYARRASLDEVLGEIQRAMEGLAWHHGNVQQHQQPEFDFEKE